MKSSIQINTKKKIILLGCFALLAVLVFTAILVPGLKPGKARADSLGGGGGSDGQDPQYCVVDQNGNRIGGPTETDPLYFQDAQGQRTTVAYVSMWYSTGCQLLWGQIKFVKTAPFNQIIAHREFFNNFTNTNGKDEYGLPLHQKSESNAQNQPFDPNPSVIAESHTLGLSVPLDNTARFYVEAFVSPSNTMNSPVTEYSPLISRDFDGTISVTYMTTSFS